MRCLSHSEREAVSICSHCGRDFCAECLVEVNGNELCKSCVAALAGRPKPAAHRHGHPHTGHEPHYYSKRRTAPSGFWLFMLGMLPGLGYMYLGMMKRGLFVMSAFFLNIYLLVDLDMPLLGFLIPIIFFASFFDGFRLLRAIKSGEEVVDSVDDFKDFLVKHKLIIGGSLLAITAFNILNNLTRGYYYVRYGAVFGGLPSLLLIGAGLYFLFYRRRTLINRGYRGVDEDARDAEDGDGRYQDKRN